MLLDFTPKGGGELIEASVWADAPHGKYVIPLDGPRRIVYVTKRLNKMNGTWGWNESPEPIAVSDPPSRTMPAPRDPRKQPTTPGTDPEWSSEPLF